jgi:peptidyl-prolyl cis-trans isomerase SurA
MKKYYIGVLVCIVSFYGLLTGQQYADRIIAIVDREIILESELNNQVQMYVLQQRLDQRRVPELKNQMLESLINKRLLLAKAIRDSVVISDNEVQQEVQNQLRQFEQAYGSLDRVAEMLGMSVPRLRREMREDIRKELLVQRLQAQKFARIGVSRREVEDFYRQFKDDIPKVPEQIDVSHIFLIPEEDEHVRENASAYAASVRDSVLSGVDFSELAARHSTDPGSASRGGDLGWVRRGIFVREFEEAVFSMSPGDVSEIIETQFGLHIIKLEERRGDAVRPRHILIKIERTEESDKPTIDLLNSLRDQIMAGASFDSLAREFSKDADTAPFGGSLGSVTVDQLDPDIRRVVANLGEGEISPPSRVNFGESYGYSIIKLNKRVPEHDVDINEDYKFLERFALQHKMELEFQKMIDDLRKEFYWEVML